MFLALKNKKNVDSSNAFLRLIYYKQHDSFLKNRFNVDKKFISKPTKID